MKSIRFTFAYDHVKEDLLKMLEMFSTCTLRVEMHHWMNEDYSLLLCILLWESKLSALIFKAMKGIEDTCERFFNIVK